jgi:hypothetical protein
MIKLIDFSDCEGYIRNTEIVPDEKVEGDEISVKWLLNKSPCAEFEYINSNDKSDAHLNAP